jgi:hypothetical protein
LIVIAGHTGSAFGRPECVLDPPIHATQLRVRHVGMGHRAFAAPKRLRPRRRVKPSGDERTTIARAASNPYLRFAAIASQKK